MQANKVKLTKLSKISLTYSPSEDRILMTGQAEDRRVLEFWLTQRLCRRLVSVVAGQVTAAGIKVADRQNAPVVERFLQSKAVSNKKASTPISHKPSASFKPQGLEVQTSPKGIFIRLPVGDDEMAILPFSYVEVRQWLDMLFQKFKQADWPLEVWPDWVKGDNNVPMSSSGTAFH